MSNDNHAVTSAASMIVVADHARARLFGVATPTAPLSEIEDLLDATARLHDADRTTDRPGRLFGGAKGHGHHSQAAGSHEEEKHQDADRFARQVCETLEKYRNAGAMNKLYVIAEPRFLGALRRHMSAQLRKHVAMEIDKDLTKQTIEGIRGALPKQL